MAIPGKHDELLHRHCEHRAVQQQRAGVRDATHKISTFLQILVDEPDLLSFRFFMPQAGLARQDQV